jgi:hypothetical protein
VARIHPGDCAATAVAAYTAASHPLPLMRACVTMRCKINGWTGCHGAGRGEPRYRRACSRPRSKACCARNATVLPVTLGPWRYAPDRRGVAARCAACDPGPPDYPNEPLAGSRPCTELVRAAAVVSRIVNPRGDLRCSAMRSAHGAVRGARQKKLQWLSFDVVL